jgi:hypothetical protein
MRTFPRCLATFREMVKERGERLRRLTLDDLKQLEGAPVERLTVESRPAVIGIIVQPKANDSLRAVVQGFMNARVVPFVKHVALDGFYKHQGETVTPMPDPEFAEFD